MVKSNRGISIIESLVCIVIIGIGFVAIMQLAAFSIGSMDRATEKNKLNYLSEMVLEDMIADPDNASKYNGFSKTCSSGNQASSDLQAIMKKNGMICCKKKILSTLIIKRESQFAILRIAKKLL